MDNKSEAKSERKKARKEARRSSADASGEVSEDASAKRERKKQRKEEKRKRRSSSSSSSSNTTAAAGVTSSVDGVEVRRESYDVESMDVVKKRHGFTLGDSSGEGGAGEGDALIEATAPAEGSSANLNSSVLSSVEEELTCAVCRELLYEPTLLACGHAYCRPCLKEALSAASAAAGDAGLLRRCLVCRANLCGCTLQLPVNIVLWNTIKLLFPAAVACRRSAHHAAVATARLMSKGEDNGRHNGGYALIQALGDQWHALGRKHMYAHATRSVVLDADDQRRQIALCFSLKLVPRSSEEDGSDHEEDNGSKQQRVVCLGDTLTVTVYVMNLEEDEAVEEPPGGFPFIFKNNKAASSSAIETLGDDDDDSDAALVMREHAGQIDVSVAGPGVAWSGTITSVNGQSSHEFTVPWGDAPGEFLLSATDQLTGAACRLKLPVAPTGMRRHCDASITRRHRHNAYEEGNSANYGGDGDSSSSSSSSEEDEELDEFEDDGFLVRSDEEEEESQHSDDDDEDDDGLHFDNSRNRHHGSRHGRQRASTERGGRNAPEIVNDSDDNNDDEDEAICAVCWESTDSDSAIVLLCEGCEDEVHLTCAGLEAVPDGDWYCKACQPSASAKAAARILAAAEQVDDEAEEGGKKQEEKDKEAEEDEDDDDKEDDDCRVGKPKQKSGRRRSAKLLDSDSE